MAVEARRGFVGGAQIRVAGAGKPGVFAAVDWDDIRNEASEHWQQALVEAVGIEPERLMVCTARHHAAPVADLAAERVPHERKAEGTVCDQAFHEVAAQRVAKALRESLPFAPPRHAPQAGRGAGGADRIESPLPQVRRLGALGADPQPAPSAARDRPAHLIDPWLKTRSFWDGDTPTAAVSAYAVHPMSYFGRGEVLADFPG